MDRAESSGLSPGRPAPTGLRLVPWSSIDPAVPIDYHMHTTYTDGSAPASEMAAAAAAAGIHEILFSEHIRHTSTYFPGFAAEVRSLAINGLNIGVGVEAKILDRDGSLDCPVEVAPECDAMIGSVHSPPADPDRTARSWSRMSVDESLELEFELAMAIVSCSRAHILGHPLGITIKKFDIKPLDHLKRIAEACAQHGKAFELNQRYCSDTAAWLKIVQEAGCPVSLGSDAHFVKDVGSAWQRFRLGAEARS